MSAVPLDRSAGAACLDAAATTHTVLIKQQTANPIPFALADIQKNVQLRANSQTILKVRSRFCRRVPVFLCGILSVLLLRQESTKCSVSCCR